MTAFIWAAFSSHVLCRAECGLEREGGRETENERKRARTREGGTRGQIGQERAGMLVSPASLRWGVQTGCAVGVILPHENSKEALKSSNQITHHIEQPSLMQHNEKPS